MRCVLHQHAPLNGCTAAVAVAVDGGRRGTEPRGTQLTWRRRPGWAIELPRAATR